MPYAVELSGKNYFKNLTALRTAVTAQSSGFYKTKKSSKVIHTLKNIAAAVEGILKKSGSEIKFDDYRPYVTNWDTISNGDTSTVIKFGKDSKNARDLQSDLGVWLLT